MSPLHPRLRVGTFLLPVLVLCLSCGNEGPAPAGKQALTTPPGGGPAASAPRAVRIASVTLASDEILLDLVDPGRIVALSVFADDPKYSNIVAEAGKVSGRVSGEPEKVIALHPDLIIVAEYSRPEFLELLSKARLNVYKAPSPNSIQAIEELILDLGKQVGEEAAAEELKNRFSERIERVRGAVRGLERPEVLHYEFSTAAGGNTLIHDLIESAGGRNIAAEKGIEGFETVGLESVVTWNPDFLLVAGPAPARTRGEAILKTLPLLARTRAFQEGNVIEMPSSLTSAVSQYFAGGVEELARLLHPEAFTDREEGMEE